MNIRTFAAASAAVGLLATASAASAAITVSSIVADDLNGTSLTYLGSGQTMLEDFDAISSPNSDYVGNEISITPDPISGSAPPPWSGGVIVGGAANPVDPTDYASVQASGIGTFSMLNNYVLSSFSFYMGSPDEYNKLTFHLADGSSQTFQGNSIWGGDPVGTGDRTQGYRVFYNFNGALVTSIDFESSQDAFEFDGLAGNAVPEPGTWALMILGFGAAGAMLRRRKLALV
jgi:hypothetical protein